MPRLALALLLLSSAVAYADARLCLVDAGNNVLDQLAATHGEIPILAMTIAGDLQGILAAAPDGKFVLLEQEADGRTCIVTIGGGLHPAAPTDRFRAEVSH